MIFFWYALGMYVAGVACSLPGVASRHSQHRNRPLGGLTQIHLPNRLDIAMQRALAEAWYLEQPTNVAVIYRLSHVIPRSSCLPQRWNARQAVQYTISSTNTPITLPRLHNLTLVSSCERRRERGRVLSRLGAVGGIPGPPYSYRGWDGCADASHTTTSWRLVVI